MNLGVVIGVVVVITAVVLAVYFMHSKDDTKPAAPASTPTAVTTGANNLLSVMNAISDETTPITTSSSYVRMMDSGQGEVRRSRADADVLMKDQAKLQLPEVASLREKAVDIMYNYFNINANNAAGAILCVSVERTIDDLIRNIGLVIYLAFQKQADLSDPAFMYNITSLMLIRYSLVSIAENKRDLIRVNKNAAGKITSLVLRPRMARLLGNLVDKIFDQYYDLPANLREFVDVNQIALEIQFGVTLGDVKATTSVGRRDAASKAAKKNALMSNAGRTFSINIFSVCMVLLASREETSGSACNDPSDDVVA